MSSDLALASRVEDRLEQFLRKALARGRRQFLASNVADRVTVGLAGHQLTVAESAAQLGPSITHCLDSTFMKNAPEISVFIDYSGWHLQDGSADVFAPRDTMLSVEQRLKGTGLRASFGEGLQVCDIFDPAQRFGVRLQAGPQATTAWEPTAPLAFFCKWIAEMQGLAMVHAASLTQDGVGALLVGHGGAGKSGTVLGGLLTGFQSAGDDYVLLSSGRPYQAHAVYRTVKQDNGGLDRLGLPLATVLNWQKKAVFRPETVGASRIVPTAPINVILVPKTGAARTTFHPIDPAEVFKILSISTLKQIGGGSEQVFAACANLVRDLPCVAVALSSDKDEIAGELAAFLRTVAC
jgi:hypothetical protein